MFIERKFASDHKLVLSCYIESLALLKCALYLEKNLPAFRPTPDIQLLHCTMYTVQYSVPWNNLWQLFLESLPQLFNNVLYTPIGE